MKQHTAMVRVTISESNRIVYIASSANPAKNVLCSLTRDETIAHWEKNFRSGSNQKTIRAEMDVLVHSEDFAITDYYCENNRTGKVTVANMYRELGYVVLNDIAK